jgi:hypothetical protein
MADFDSDTPDGPDPGGWYVLPDGEMVPIIGNREQFGPTAGRSRSFVGDYPSDARDGVAQRTLNLPGEPRGRRLTFGAGRAFLGGPGFFGAITP